MTVSAQTTVNSSAGNGVTTVFPYAFKILRNADLEVLVDGVVQTLTTHYTVSGAGSDGGGDVTFASAPASGAIVVRRRNMQFLRSSDFQYQGDLPNTVINADLDAPVLMAQQLQEQVGRAVRGPAGEAWDELPAAADRLDYLLAFDVTTGAPELSRVTHTQVQSAVAAAYAAGSTADAVTYLAEGTGAVSRTAQSRMRERVSIKDFGAVGDGIADNSAAFLLAIASNRHVYVPPGTYLISSSVTASSLSNFVIEGAGSDVSIIKCSGSATFANIPFNIQTSSDVSVRGLTFDHNSNASVASFVVVRFVGCTDFEFSENRILHGYIGLGVDSCTRFRVTKNHLKKDAVATTLNYNINVSSTSSVSRYGVVKDNFCQNSGTGFIGADLAISGNYFVGNSYGAGIATFAEGAGGTTPGEFYGRYTITNNTCLNGTQRDVDGFMVSGMEIAGPYSQITGNIIANNAGEGIRLFAYQSVVANNVIYGNGTGTDGTFTQGGIVPFDATTIPGYNASYSLITGNRCFDNGGNTQTYGYYEQQSTLLGMKVKGNDFGNNYTGPFLLASSKTANYYEFDDPISYTPTMASSVGTITTIGTRTGAYLLKGRMCYFQAQGTITTNGGTAAGSITLTLPVTAALSAAYRFIVAGRGDAVSGNTLTGVIAPGGTSVVLTNYDGTYPGADGERIAVSGWYQI